jgi:hypothetical protein
MWAIWNTHQHRWLVAGSDSFIRVFSSEIAALNWHRQMAMPPSYVVCAFSENPETPSEGSESTHDAL